MQGASVNTAIPKGKFNRRVSEFGLLQLKIPGNDSLFPLWCCICIVGADCGTAYMHIHGCIHPYMYPILCIVFHFDVFHFVLLSLDVLQYVYYVYA